jgi:hypothetical protein
VATFTGAAGGPPPGAALFAVHPARVAAATAPINQAIRSQDMDCLHLPVLFNLTVSKPLRYSLPCRDKTHR